MEDWAKFRCRHRLAGLPIKAIVLRLGNWRNAVRRELTSQGPPRSSRPSRDSSVGAFEPQIRVRKQIPTTIVMVNRVPNVPIFELADYGVGGRALQRRPPTHRRDWPA